jgi:hypothetical protein
LNCREADTFSASSFETPVVALLRRAPQDEVEIVIVLILRSGPKVRVSKDGATSWFETRSFAALLTMRPN